jgi:putative ABC transport system permease protein
MGPLAQALQHEFPEVVHAVRLKKVSDIIRIGDQNFRETNILAASENFFKLFSFMLIEGNPNTALSEPYNVIVTRTIARKYFGDDKNIVGKTILDIDNIPM